MKIKSKKQIYANKEVIEKFIKEFNEKLTTKDYDFDQVINLDESSV